MSERKYSVSEIDAMREFLRRRETAKVYVPHWGRGPYPTVLIQEAEARSQKEFVAAEHRAEDQLRTYMLAGIDPGDLYGGQER